MQKTKQILIDAARQVFAKIGFSRATMNDIAEASNKGRRTLYTYFKSKNDVYEALVTRELDQLTVRLQKMMNQLQDPRDQIVEFIFIHLQSIKEIINNNGTLRADFFNDIKAVERVRRKTDVQEILMLKQILQAGVEKKIFNVGNVEMAPTIIFYAIKGLEVPYAKDYFSMRLNRHKSKIARFVLAGLEAKDF